MRSRDSVPMAENMSANFATSSTDFLAELMRMFPWLQKYERVSNCHTTILLGSFGLPSHDTCRFRSIVFLRSAIWTDHPGGGELRFLFHIRQWRL